MVARGGEGVEEVPGGGGLAAGDGGGDAEAPLGGGEVVDVPASTRLSLSSERHRCVTTTCWTRRPL
jgi:hypothetical protein